MKRMSYFFVQYRKKYEIATDEEFTPIKQDEKKGKLREVCDYSIGCFSFVDFYIFLNGRL